MPTNEHGLFGEFPNPRSTSFASSEDEAVEVELSPDYPGRGDGARAPLDVPHGDGFGTGC